MSQEARRAERIRAGRRRAPDEKQLVSQLASVNIESGAAVKLGQQFARLVREYRGSELEDWLMEAEESGLRGGRGSTGLSVFRVYGFLLLKAL